MAGALLPLMAGITSAANLNSRQPQTSQLNQQNPQVATSPEQTAQYQPKLERAKDLIGSKVVNDKGEQLGTIKDVVLTPGRDGINYVVLSHSSGTWGTGEKYFAVPWSQLSVRPDQKLIVLNGVSKADLDRAPGFDKDHWPATASANWLGIEPSSGMTPSGSASMPAPSEQRGMATAPESKPYTGAPVTDIQQLRLSKLFGTDIRNLQGENLGKLDNVMIDLNQGKLAYGIVSIRSGFLGMNKDFAAVPWTALDWTAQPGIARLDVDRQTLASIAFGRDNFPDLANPQYSRQLFDRFHVTPYWEGQNLGFIPGQENPNVNPPSSEGMKVPNSGMTAPNAAPNSAATEMIAHHTDHQALSYNPNAVETIRGTIHSVGTYKIEGTSVKGVLLHIRADDGRMMWVQAGPRPYVDSQNIRFAKGEAVTVTGSVARTGHHHETIVASQIQTANRTLALRAPDGRPLWDLSQYQGPTSTRGYSYGY
jgi:sporulation protein YlmC with PRC-barrel domain